MRGAKSVPALAKRYSTPRAARSSRYASAVLSTAARLSMGNSPLREGVGGKNVPSLAPGGGVVKSAGDSPGRTEGRRVPTGERLAGGPLGRSLGVLLVEGVDPSLETLDQLRVAGGADHAVELRAIVGDQAQVLHQDVVDEPAVALAEEPGLHRHLGALGGDDARPDDRTVAVDLLAHVGELLATVLVDARDIRLLEQVGEELRELLALGGGALLPVLGKHTLGRFRGVEDLAGDLAHRLPFFREREPGALQDFQDLIGVRAELVRGSARPAGRPQAQHEGHGEKKAQVPVHAVS